VGDRYGLPEQVAAWTKTPRSPSSSTGMGTSFPARGRARSSTGSTGSPGAPQWPPRPRQTR